MLPEIELFEPIFEPAREPIEPIISDAKIIADTKLFEAYGISVRCGRQKVSALESRQLVTPARTLTGRRLLSYREAKVIIEAFRQASSDDASERVR